MNDSEALYCKDCGTFSAEVSKDADEKLLITVRGGGVERVEIDQSGNSVVLVCMCGGRKPVDLNQLNKS